MYLRQPVGFPDILPEKLPHLMGFDCLADPVSDIRHPDTERGTFGSEARDADLLVAFGPLAVGFYERFENGKVIVGLK